MVWITSVLAVAKSDLLTTASCGSMVPSISVKQHGDKSPENGKIKIQTCASDNIHKCKIKLCSHGNQNMSI